jgi:hypothetical protein
LALLMAKERATGLASGAGPGFAMDST